MNTDLMEAPASTSAAQNDSLAVAPTVAAQAVGELVDNGPSFGDIPLDCIRVSKTNPRKIFNDEQLQELSESIKKQGVAQPILVRPIDVVEGVTYFELVAGERRYRASRLAGKATIPAIVRVLSDEVAYELQVLENLQRVDLHPLEEAEGFEVWMEEFPVTVEQMAEKAGKSKAYMYASLKLCALVPKAREAFYAGKLNKSTALLVARIPVKNLQEKAVKEITEHWNGPMSVRTASDHIEKNYMLSLSKAHFKPSDETLLPAAGSCTTCPKRTGNQPEIFTDVKNAHVCTDPVCYKDKSELHVVRVKKLAKESGQPVLSGAEAKKVMPYCSSGDLKGGYVAVDLPVYSDSKRRSYRQMLGKDLPQTTLLESPHNGELVQVIKLDQIKPILEEKGHTTPKAAAVDNSAREREKEHEVRIKREREYRKQLFRATHDASLMMNLIDDDLRLVAAQLFDALGWGMLPTKFLIELYGWTEDMFGHPRRENIKKAIDALTQAQLNQFIRDCTLCRELDVRIWSDGKSKPENLLAFAKRTKVDAKAIRAAIEAEAKAKADKKNKGAAKETPAGKTAKKPAKVQDATKKLTPEAAWPFPTSSTPAPTAAPIIEQPEAEQSTLWPFPINVSSMTPAVLAAFIDEKPNLINDLAAAIVDRGSEELANALRSAADERGYKLDKGMFQLQESQPQAAAPAEHQAEQAAAGDEPQAAAVADQVDAGLDDMAAAADGAKAKTLAKPGTKKAKRKAPATAEAGA